MASYSVSQQLHEDLGKLIAATQPGGRLPSEPVLAQRLGVSRATLREAMRTFETQGFLRRKQGSGTFVMHPASIFESGLEVLESIETMADRIGLTVSMGRAQIHRRQPSTEEADALEISAADEIVDLSRVILVEDHPIAYLVDIVPVEYANLLDLEEEFSGSMLDIFLKRGDPPLGSSRTEINAVAAPVEIARSLGIQRGSVLLQFVAFLYTPAGRVVDYSYSYFLPGYFRFHVVRRVGS